MNCTLRSKFLTVALLSAGAHAAPPAAPPAAPKLAGSMVTTPAPAVRSTPAPVTKPTVAPKPSVAAKPGPKAAAKPAAKAAPTCPMPVVAIVPLDTPVVEPGAKSAVDLKKPPDSFTAVDTPMSQGSCRREAGAVICFESDFKTLVQMTLDHKADSERKSLELSHLNEKHRALTAAHEAKLAERPSLAKPLLGATLTALGAAAVTSALLMELPESVQIGLGAGGAVAMAGGVAVIVF